MRGGPRISSRWRSAGRESVSVLRPRTARALAASRSVSSSAGRSSQPSSPSRVERGEGQVTLCYKAPRKAWEDEPMSGIGFSDLLIVTVVAFSAPFVLGLAPGLRLPAVVLEIVAGIAIGPSGFGWVEIDEPIDVLSLIGLAFLLFL